MEYLFIDESGSMTCEYAFSYPYFVICIIRSINKDKLKTIFKRYVSKKLSSWIENDSELIKNGKFKELKGSKLSYLEKIDFASFITENNYFEVYYIVVINNKITKRLYENKARAFNYLLEETLNYCFKNNLLPFDDYFIQIDERNIKNNSIKSLEDYLATSFMIKENYINSIVLEYYDSKDNLLIQLADFFSNFYYSYLMHRSSYSSIIYELRRKKIIKCEFIFPIK